MEDKKKKLNVAVIGTGGLSKAERVINLIEKEKVTIIDTFANTPMIIKALPEIVDDYNNLSLTKKEKQYKILPINTEPKIGRNQPCTCFSGKKYKHCCGKINK
jgi:uncharacterized protein YecA (UPF0149 family)